MNSDLIAQAKQGEANAIATLINRQLHRQGVTAQVTQEGKGLRIVLDAKVVPARTAMVQYFQKAFDQLQAPSIQVVNLYGRSTQNLGTPWQHQLRLSPLPGPQEREATPQAAFHSELPKPPQTRHHASPTLPHRTKQRGSRRTTYPTSPSLLPFWLGWQAANLKAGLLMLFVFWMIASLLFLVLGEFFGMGGGGALVVGNVLAGLMGLAIGGIFLGDSQAYYLKQDFQTVGNWRWLTAIGFALSLAIALIVQLIGNVFSTFLGLMFAPLGAVAALILLVITGGISGATLGGLQWLALRQSLSPAYGWVLWSALGGSLGWGAGIVVVAVFAGASAYNLNGAGGDLGSSLSLSVMVAGCLGLITNWLVFHAISGVQMARFLRELRSR